MSDSFVTLWTIAHQIPLSMGLYKQEYCSGLPCLVRSPALACGFFTSSATREALKIGKGGLSRWLRGKESTYQTRDGGLIPGLGRSPAEGNDKNKQRKN